MRLRIKDGQYPAFTSLCIAAALLLFVTGCSTSQWPSFSLFDNSESSRGSGSSFAGGNDSNAIGSGVSSGAQWLTSLEEAREISKATGKPILAEFTGSDWCSYCIKLHDEVFAQPEFERWAAEKYVLLQLDYPQRTSQPQELKDQNDSLKRQYNISSFPTVLLLDVEGSVIGRAGYVSGGPSAWIAEVESTTR
ncbi:MAG: thioredoxin family protein [Planctomycetota bacterium]